MNTPEKSIAGHRIRLVQLAGVGTGLLLLLAFGTVLHAQQTKTPPAQAAAPQAATSSAVPFTTRELTAADLEAFLDGLVPAQLEREDVAGAVVAVVKDGRVLFAKGFGFSDVAKRKPVSPSETLFRPGSISKLFTWTSVMQLVEQGKLDLDRDVNDYIDFKIPPAFDKPITLRNIMTHTPGFEETGKELFVSDAAHVRPLGEYLRDHLPARIFPPGTTPAYSNYGTALAGYIVQRVSGKPFDQYVVENIYGPLAMPHTTFVQPLPSDLQPLMSNGYLRASQPEKPYEFVQAYPAGSVATSAADMCNFMIAHLQDGQFGSARILKPETAKLMHSRQFGSDPRLNSMALGFYEETRNGHRIIGHGGDTVYFHSDLHLIPDANVGFFVSYNSLGKTEISPRTVLFEKFLDRYFPYTPPPAAAVPSAKEDAQLVSGLYLASRRGETTFFRLTTLFGELRVLTNSDGTISIDPLKGPNGELKRFTEISPLLYREVNGQDQIAFHRDARQRLEFSIDYPFFVFQRSGGTDNKYFNFSLILPGLIIILLTLLLWPVAAGIRWHYGRKLELESPEKRLRLVVRFVCILDIVFILAWAVVISMAQDPSAFSRSLDPILYGIQFAGVLGAIGTLLVLFYAMQSWSKAGRWVWSKIFDTLLALSCVAFTWFIWHWNLINFNLKY
jgi:CubicO group peptidase (beta-lactamase class C family)